MHPFIPPSPQRCPQLVAVHLNHWVLDIKLGVAFMGVYVIFLVLSTLIEMNVFGYVNAPMCKGGEGL